MVTKKSPPAESGTPEFLDVLSIPAGVLGLVASFIAIATTAKEFAIGSVLATGVLLGFLYPPTRTRGLAIARSTRARRVLGPLMLGAFVSISSASPFTLDGPYGSDTTTPPRRPRHERTFLDSFRWTRNDSLQGGIGAADPRCLHRRRVRLAPSRAGVAPSIHMTDRLGRWTAPSLSPRARFTLSVPPRLIAERGLVLFCGGVPGIGLHRPLADRDDTAGETPTQGPSPDPSTPAPPSPTAPPPAPPTAAPTAEPSQRPDPPTPVPPTPEPIEEPVA